MLAGRAVQEESEAICRLIVAARRFVVALHYLEDALAVRAILHCLKIRQLTFSINMFLKTRRFAYPFCKCQTNKVKYRLLEVIKHVEVALQDGLVVVFEDIVAGRRSGLEKGLDWLNFSLYLKTHRVIAESDEEPER